MSTSSSRRLSTSPQRYKFATQEVPSLDAKPFSQIPGPLALPMLRHSAHVLPRIGSFHHTVGLGLLEGLRDRYGDLVRLAKASRTRPVLYVFDPEMMREVYESGVTEPPCWHQSPLRQQRKQTTSKCPVRGEDTKAIWLAIRALLLDGRLIQQYDEAFKHIAADVTRRLGELRLAENALNEELETEMFRWAIECVGMMVFGIRLGCLDGATYVPNDENRKPLQNPMDEDTRHTCSLTKRPLSELSQAELLVRTSREIADHNYMVRGEDTLKCDSEVFNNALTIFDRHYCITQYFLNQAMEQLKTDVRKEQVLLDKLRPLDTRILTLASDLLLSGVDPLAHTAISMLYHLSLNPAQQQRAHDEILWSTASEDAGAGRQELPYVAACAREVIRMHPATGGVIRRSREALVVGGYEVPDGVDIVLAHGVTSKSDKQWGRAKAFIPERWCDAGWQPLKSSRAHPFASLPFGESCPATGIANSMLASLASQVLVKFRLEWHGPAPKLVTAGVNELQPPFYFVLEKAT